MPAGRVGEREPPEVDVLRADPNIRRAVTASEHTGTMLRETIWFACMTLLLLAGIYGFNRSDLRAVWRAKPLPPDEPKYQRSVLVRQFFGRLRAGMAVLAIAMLSAVVALELVPVATPSDPNPTLNLGHWVGTNLVYLGFVVVYLWFDLVTRASWLLWRLSDAERREAERWEANVRAAQRRGQFIMDSPEPRNFKDHSRILCVVFGWFFAFLVCMTLWGCYGLATGSRTLI